MTLDGCFSGCDETKGGREGGGGEIKPRDDASIPLPPSPSSLDRISRIKT